MTTLDQSQAPTWQDDQTQSGYVTPDMAPRAAGPGHDRASAAQAPAPPAPDTSGPALGPARRRPQPSFPQRVVDTATSIPGAIQSGLSAAGSALQSANTAASNAVNAVTGGISQASSELGSALTAAACRTCPAIVGAVGGQGRRPRSGHRRRQQGRVQRAQQIRPAGRRLAASAGQDQPATCHWRARQRQRSRLARGEPEPGSGVRRPPVATDHDRRRHGRGRRRAPERADTRGRTTTNWRARRRRAAPRRRALRPTFRLNLEAQDIGPA